MMNIGIGLIGGGFVLGFVMFALAVFNMSRFHVTFSSDTRREDFGVMARRHGLFVVGLGFSGLVVVAGLLVIALGFVNSQGI